MYDIYLLQLTGLYQLLLRRIRPISIEL